MKYVRVYSIHFPSIIVYMMQSSGYDIGDFFDWFWRTKDFSKVVKRKSLDMTRKATLLLMIARFIMAFTVTCAVTLVAMAYFQSSLVLIFAGAFTFIALPVIVVCGTIVPLWFGQNLVQKPKEKRLIAEAQDVIAKHPALKIAIAGSYGKTTAKEALSVVLGVAKKVAATPGNYNTPLGISRFVQSLGVDEEILIFELGESHVGDIATLCKLTQPDIGYITGINEAHLKTFKKIENTVATIFELGDYLGDKKLYKNTESHLVQTRAVDGDSTGFSRRGIAEWQVQNIVTSKNGTAFELVSQSASISIKTPLLGEHNIGIFSAIAACAYELGLTSDEIEQGFSRLKTVPHRLQPREVGGAIIIDDTYNGNIEGVEAGIYVLKQLEARKKIYVTPGLVEQGSKSHEIHQKIGRLIAIVADEVILMKNSTSKDIQIGLNQADFKGSVQLIEEPLKFYENLDQIVAAGDVVLLQNDWTDNYA